MVDVARLQVGAPVDDLCRACKMERKHTVLAIDSAAGRVVVLCDTCGSRHRLRGGSSPRGAGAPASRGVQESFGLVSERERRWSVANEHGSGAGSDDLELLLRRVIREECGLTPVAPAKKWIGGELVLRPAAEGVQEKTWPIETFFQKVVMVRNRLRTLEQQVNAADIPAAAKAKIQGYISGCYGSLTSFNVLFAEEKDRFRSGDSR